MDERDFEAQTSGLAARPGALLLDYLRVRLPDDRDTWQALQGWLGPMTSRGCGWRGWYSDSAHVLDGGLVAWCQDAKRREVWGLLVDLPGRACGAMGAKLVPFLQWALERGKATRIDYAADDHEGRLTFERVAGALRSGALVSSWSERNIIENCGKAGGWTVYVGSRSSECLVRIYDKHAEQARKGRDVAGPWVRLELECHADFADRLAREYFRVGSSAVIGQLNRRVRFIEVKCTDTNKRRAPAASWWVQFIGSVQPGAALTVGEAPECTVSRLAAFVEKQCGPALVTIVKGAHGDLGQLVGILDRSAYRLKPKHFAALALQGGA